MNRGKKIAALLELRDGIRECRGCSLRDHYDKPVPFAGNPDATIMLVGEAPGADEVDQGKPFVGRSGQLLRRAVERAGIESKTELMVGNVLFCRPPNNKFPTNSEPIIACIHWIHSLVDIVRPKVVVAVGGRAHENLRGSNVGITRACGIVEDWEMDLPSGSLNVRYIPTLHPSFCLRPGNPSSDNPVMSLDVKGKKRLLLEHLRIAKREADSR
jgi:uracil-DNA glycosylase family 4